jgi:hypothetical protein
MAQTKFKIEVRFQVCDDGDNKRLRVWSPDVPGFRLSNTNFDAVIADVIPALSDLLSERLGKRMSVFPLQHLSELDSNVELPLIMPKREYVSEAAA